MSAQSPRNQVLGGVIAVAAMSFLLGVFLVLGVERILQHDLVYTVLTVLLLPMLAVAGALNARRILQAVSDPRRGGAASEI